jgi:hypothetical protein
MSDFYSGWLAPPNGYAKYRLHFSVTVASQNVDANSSTLEWWATLEKSRSQNGFYNYAASWSATINGVTVMNGSGSVPSGPWTGWSSWTLGHGWITVAHDDDGTKTTGVTGSYVGANTGWAIGTVALVGDLNMALPPLPRATTPAVTPSPATINTGVTITLPRASAAFTHDLTWVSGTLSGTIATGVATSQTWTVPDVMAQYPDRVLAPIVITAVTKSGTTVIGSKQVTLFAKNPPPPPVVTPHDATTQFDVRARLVKYTSADGEWSARQQIPASSLQLVTPNSATATCTLGLSKLNAVDFTDYSIVDVDVFDGTNWRFTNHRFVLTRTDTDDIDPTKVGTYTGPEFVDYELGFARIPVDYFWDGSEGHAGPTTPGEMLRYAISAAKARGWGPRIEFEFSGTMTSLGEPWTNTAVSRTWSKGIPISQMLSGLVEDGLVEYRTEYRDNKAWLVLLNPGTGSDYSADGATPIVNLGLTKLSRAPRRATMEKQLTAVTVAGDDTIQITREKAPFDSDVFGRMEGWVSASGVKDTNAANVIGDNALRDNSTPTAERTFEYQAQEVTAQYYPFVVFLPGDWLLIPDGDNSIKDRINQITINKTADNALSLTVLTGDRILSGTASLAKRQAAQTGGSISGGSGTTPSPLDSRIPAAPVVNSVTSVGYWNSDGAAKSAVTVTWAAVTQAMNTADISVDLYEVWWRPSGIDAEWVFRGSTDALTITLNDWDVLTAIDLRVRARSIAGVFGEFSEDQEGYITQAPAVDLSGPIIADLYTDGVGSIYVVWAGILGTDPAPARLAYVVAEVSSDGGTTYTTMGTPIAGPGTIVVNPGAYGGYTVRIRGYDRLGNPGDASAAQSIALLDPHLNEIVTLSTTSQVLVEPASGGATVPATTTVTGTAQNTTITVWQYSADGAAFSSTAPAGVSRAGNVVTITGATMTARTIAVRMADANGTSDTLTVAKVVDGATGAPGTPGKGVSSTAVTYQASSSGTVAPTGTWTSTVPAVAAGQYLWTRTVITYTDSTTSTSYSVGKMGSDGTPGDPGTNGQTSYFHVAYATNSTGTTGFSTTDPTGKTYLGTYTDFTATDSTDPTKYAWSLIKGADGLPGKGISSSTVTYQVGTSGTVVPTGTWLSSVPATSPGQFLWTRTVLQFTDGASTTGYSVAAYGATGATGADAYTVLLSNESHTFPGTAQAAVAGSVSSTVIAYKGATQIVATVGTITGQVTGLTTAVTGNGTTAPVITITVTTDLVTQGGVLAVPITVDGKVFNKTISWTVARSTVSAPIPTAPTGLTATAGASWDASGFFPTAWFDLAWTVPTLDNAGNPVNIAGYDIWGKSATETISRFLTSSPTNSVRIEVKNDEDWSFQVVAISDDGGVSPLSTPVNATANATIAPPTAPTAPTLSQYAGLLRIQWAGGGMAPQIKYAFASISTSAGGTYTRAGMPLNGAGEVVVPGLAPGTYYAKMNLVDERGQTVAGPASAGLLLLPITGITVQTSELANTGIKMTSAALTAYDVSGNPTFVLNAATGEVWIAPYDAVFDLGATGNVATTGAATTGIAISSDNSSFNTFVHPAGLQIRNDQTPLSWWEADATDANLVNFFSPRAVIGDRLRIGDYEMVREAKSTGSRLVIRYKGA